MSKFDFSNLTNEEILMKEKEVNEELSTALYKMIYNDKLEEMYKELEAIKEEKSRRDIDG